MIDSVWTSDHHPSLCGTAKFSHQLARRLGVPVVPWGTLTKHPLISVRASEVEQWGAPPPCFDLFLHDWWNWDGGLPVFVERATRIYAANQVLAREIRPFRADVQALWAPSTIEGTSHRGNINVLTFGMAHKIQPAKYQKLKALLDATGEDYTVSVSTAIHEGSPWDETAHVADKLRAIFGDQLRVLGYLADDALVAEMARASAIAVFFDPAVRENNTTFWAALRSGKPVITNRDWRSPSGGLDIDYLDRWPRNGRVELVHLQAHYSWDALMNRLQEVPCAS